MAPKGSPSPSPRAAPSSPLLTLTAAFVAWKLFLLLLSFGALVGADYDTSTSLFFDVLAAHSGSSGEAASLGGVLARRLTRWDAIYFVHGARVGYVYEQEWAFSPTLALFLRWLASHVRALLNIPTHEADYIDALMGVAVAHASHWIAVMALYKLTTVLSSNRNNSGADRQTPRLALLASLLCIVSPAGIFLSAPYGESPFSALSFAGVLVLALAYRHASGSLTRSAGVLVAGAVLGLATAVRSNGLAAGLVFAVEALRAVAAFAKRPGFTPVVAAGAAGLGGILVALGSVIPQYVAYNIYCAGPLGPLRPWCENTVPSIYSYVQDVYW